MAIQINVICRLQKYLDLQIRLCTSGSKGTVSIFPRFEEAIFKTICEGAQKNESEVADELSEKVALKVNIFNKKVKFLYFSNHFIFGSNRNN